MSYEGYIQKICNNGHYRCEEDHPYMCDDDIEVSKCPTCQENIVWINRVDTTNCDEVGYILMDTFLLTPVESQTCNLGHSHITKLATYRIPTHEETKTLRSNKGRTIT